jgi:hypothetical protein
MRIYLAGKIAAFDWRHLIVRGLTDRLKNMDPNEGWPILEASIYTIHDYTGPYFKNMGEVKNGAQEPSTPAPKVHRRCLEAIRNSDLVYAWVDDPTCYATIYEMGFAHALGIYTAVAYPVGFDRRELWFMSACSDEIIEANTPELGLLSSTMRALKSGKLQHPNVELERVTKNLQRLQQASIGDIHESKKSSKATHTDSPRKGGGTIGPGRSQESLEGGNWQNQGGAQQTGRQAQAKEATGSTQTGPSGGKGQRGEPSAHE